MLSSGCRNWIQQRPRKRSKHKLESWKPSGPANHRQRYWQAELESRPNRGIANHDERKEVKRAAAANSSRCQNSSTHQSHLGSPQSTWCTRAKATSNGSTGGPPERVAIPKSTTALSRPSGWLGCACRGLWYRLS